MVERRNAESLPPLPFATLIAGAALTVASHTLWLPFWVDAAAAAHRRRSEICGPHARTGRPGDVAAVLPVSQGAGAPVGHAAGRLQHRDGPLGDHVARFDQLPVAVGRDRVQGEIPNRAAPARPALLARPSAVGFRRLHMARRPAPAAPEYERRGRRFARRLRSDPRAPQPQLDVRAGNPDAHPPAAAPHPPVPPRSSY